MERIYRDYEDQGFFPILVMYDGTSSQAMALANDLDLNFPILLDPGLEVFDRFNPDGETPTSTFLTEGSVVHTIDVGWYPALVEEILAE